MDGSPVVDEHRCGAFVRLLQQIDPIDAAQRYQEAQRGAPAIAVRLVQAQDERFSILGSLQAAERKRQTVEVEEVIDLSLRSAARGRGRDQRRVQRERFADDIALGPVSRMREKAVGEGMASLIRARVREERAA